MGTADEMARWHHQMRGREFEQTLGDGEGQGSLAGCSPWGRKQTRPSDSTMTMTREQPLRTYTPCPTINCSMNLHRACVNTGASSTWAGDVTSTHLTSRGDTGVQKKKKTQRCHTIVLRALKESSG